MAYDPKLADLSPEEHALAAALYGIVEAVMDELEDEDPGKIDFDDIIQILSKSPAHVVTLFGGLKDNYKDPKLWEAIGHGVARQLL